MLNVLGGFLANVQIYESLSPSPLFLCCYLIRLSEAGPRQLPRVPAQHAVTQRLQVAASRGSCSRTHTQTHKFSWI